MGLKRRERFSWRETPTDSLSTFSIIVPLTTVHSSLNPNGRTPIPPTDSGVLTGRYGVNNVTRSES